MKIPIQSKEKESDNTIKVKLCDKDEAQQLGFATFNNGPHLCVNIPDGPSTITCRTNSGNTITFAFAEYQEGQSPQIINVQTKNVPNLIRIPLAPIKLEYKMKFDIKGRGPVYIVDYDLYSNLMFGQVVEINNELYKVTGIEKNSTEKFGRTSREIGVIVSPVS